MSWRQALWEKVSLVDGDVTVANRQAKTRYGAFDAPAPEPSKANRRAEPRYPAADVPAIGSVLMQDQPVTLINISASGALVESTNRMKPGARVRLTFTGLMPSQASGGVVRCVVASISAGGKLRYETAIAFSERVNFPVDPAAAPSSAGHPNADAETVPDTTTMTIAPGAMSKVAPAPSPAPEPAPTEQPVPQLSPELAKMLAEASRSLPAVRNRW